MSHLIVDFSANLDFIDIKQVVALVIEIEGVVALVNERWLHLY